MAKTIGTSWTNVASYQFAPGTGFKATFYLDARYSSSEKNNIEGNYSNIYTRLRSVINAGQGSGYGYNFTCSYAPTVSGSGLWYLGTETITESAITKVYHNDDGTKTITLSASGTISPIGLNFSISEQVVLDTIPRATRLTNQTGTIGQLLDINWIKASTSFTHKLTYSFDNIEDAVLGTDLVDGYTWEIPTSLYQNLPNANGTGTLKLTTYNGTTQIGSTQEATLTLNANESLSKPVVNNASIKDINSSTIALTGDNGTFVLGKSIGLLEMTFKTRNYAKIKNVTINNVAIDINRLESSTSSGTTTYGLQENLGIVSSDIFVVVITDTRGFSETYNLLIGSSALINYTPLDATFSFKRISPTTGEVGAIFEGNYFNGSFGATTNSLTISYKYKKKEETNYSANITFANNTDYKISGNKYYSGTSSSKSQIKLAPTFDYRYIYELQVTVKDKITTLPTITILVVKGVPILWWNDKKVTINGDLYIADTDGNNPINVKDMSGSAPIGQVTNFAGENIPDGWMICDGRELPRTDYADLFNAIGTVYGEGDGSTTFNIPNVKGRVVVSVDENQEEFAKIGQIGGSKYLQEHDHFIKDAGYDGGSSGDLLNFHAKQVQVATYMKTGLAGTGDSGNLQPYIVLHTIIKATNVVSTFPENTTAKVIDNLDGTSTTDAPSVRAVNKAVNGFVLYDNSSGASETITLNDSIENYKYIEITGSRAIVHKFEVARIGTEHIPIQHPWYDANNNAPGLFMNFYTMSGNKITYKKSLRWYQYGSSPTVDTNNNVKIYKVVGYK